MSGHSKWSSIKHKKGAADAKRGKLFTKLARSIIVAAKEGGVDPANNLALQNAIEKARSYSMPKDNIERAIAKGTGEGADADALETVLYEGYGPGGVALLVEALTDNRNRTGSEVRHMFSKNGGNLGEQGSVAWMFERKSQIIVPLEKAGEDQLMSIVLDAGADDLRNEGDNWTVLSPPEAHEAVLQALTKAGIETSSAEIAMVPKNLMRIEGKNASGMLRLSEALEEHDDVQNVYSNFDVDEKELEAMA